MNFKRSIPLYFPISGVQVNPFIPLVVAFVVSFFTSMGGITGAFLLLPFQVSFLGFTSPSVSATNLVYNIVAIPSGVYSYIKQERMAWPLAGVTIAGTLPGMFIGAMIRIHYLHDPRDFKVFVGLVLLYVGLRLLFDLIPRGKGKKTRVDLLEENFLKISQQMREQTQAGGTNHGAIKTIGFSLTTYSYRFCGETFSFNPMALFAVTLFIGVIGGIYGIGGGALIAPFLIAIFRLPVYTIAGAALFGTFITSLGGIIFYSLLEPYYAHAGLAIAPDWMLGGIFGIGGFLGIYCGARCQKYMPAGTIKLVIGLVILFFSISYIGDFF